MTDPTSRGTASLQRLTEMADYIVPFTLRAVCDLGVADELAAGPVGVEELARRTGTHAFSLYRALRALASRGVFTEVEPRVFALTELGQPLRSDHPLSLREAYPLLVGDVEAWAHLGHSLRTGRSAFDEAHGTDYWTYLAERPGDSARFDASQRAVSRREVRALVPAYDWGRFSTIVDVGGGNGTFLAAVLAAHPHLRGTLFDQPHVVSSAGPVLAERGVAERAEVVGGSFLDAVPAGADAYVVKRALYDLDDAGASAMLKVVRAAMRPDSTLLVVEPVVEPGDAFDWGKLYDLLLLVMRGGGGRSPEQLAALLAGADLDLVGVSPTRSLSIVEARPRPPLG